MPPRDYNPKQNSLGYACLIELYKAGACPSGSGSSLSKVELEAAVEAGGLSQVSPGERSGGRSRQGHHFSNSALDWTLPSLNKHRQDLLKSSTRAGHGNTHFWRLLPDGERIAKALCLRDGIPLPAWDAGQHGQQAQHVQHQVPQHQVSHQQGQQRTPPAGAAQPPTPAAARGPRRGATVSRLVAQQAAREVRILSPAGAAALRREQQRRQQEEAALLAAPGNNGAGPAGHQARLAGSKRPASEVVDLLDSDDDDEHPAGRCSGAVQAHQHASGSGTGSGAGPSCPAARQQAAPLPPLPHTPMRQQQWSEQARHLADVLGVSERVAAHALEQHGGDLQLAAESLLDSIAAQEAAVHSPVAAAAAPSPAAGAHGLGARAAAGAAAAARAAAAAGATAAAAQEAAAAPTHPAAQAAGTQNGVLSGGAFDPAAAWAPRQHLALPPLAAGQSFGTAYEVVLLLDCHERQRAQRDLSFLLNALRQRGVAAEQRQLPVGDALWVARPRAAGPSSAGQEYVLDYVLERKSSQDLLSSIKDGRYVAQKWRMMTCGLANRLYLVETDGDRTQGGKSKKAIQTARVSTQVIDGFTVLYSRAFSSEILRPNTVDWLANLTGSVLRRYEHEAASHARGLMVGSASQPAAPLTFAGLGLRVRQQEEAALAGGGQWQLCLMAATAGISLAAAEVVAARYPSPITLLQAVRLAGVNNVAVQMAALRCGANRGGGQAITEQQAVVLLQRLFPAEQREVI